MICRRDFPAILALSISLLLAAARAGADDQPILRIEPGGHTARVTKVLFSGDRDHNWLISVGEDKAARIWDLDTGRQVRTLRGQISADRRGQLFAAAANDKTLAVAGDMPKAVITDDRDFASREGYLQAFRFFNLVSGKIARKPQTWHHGVVTTLAFNRSGERLASGSRDSLVLVWSFYEREDPKELKGHQGGVNEVVFSPADDKWLASGGDDGTVRFWDWAAKKPLVRTIKLGSPVLCVAWAPDGRTLLAGTREGKVHFLDPETGKPLRDAVSQDDSVTTLAVSPDKSWFVTGSGAGSADFRVRVWSFAEGTVARSFDRHSAAIQSVAMSPDGRWVASADRAGVIYVWDPVTLEERWQFGGAAPSAFSVAWSQDGKRIAWGSNPRDPKELTHTFLLDRGVPGPPPRPDEPWVFGASSTGGRSVGISPDHRTVQLQENGRTVSQLTLPMPNDEAWATILTPRREVVVGTEFELRLYDAGLGKRSRARFVGHDGAVRALSVSPDGRFLASASEDKTVRIWSLERGGDVEPLLSLVATLDGHWIAWTPRGFYAASPSGDDIIGWHVNRGDDVAADFYTAYQFRKRFYRPDVIRHVVEAGDVNRAVQMADRESHHQTEATLSIEQEVARAPAVEIMEVGPVPGVRKEGLGYQSDRAEVTLTVHVDRADAATAVRVQVNHPAGSRRLVEAKPSGRANEWILPAALTQGDNSVAVVATNQAGESSPAIVTVRYEPPAGARKPSKLYVLCIGVKDYADPGIEKLSYADADATALASFYQGQRGKLYDSVEVRTLLNRSATRQAVLNGISWLETMGSEDSAILFVSSHGFRGSDVTASASRGAEDASFYFAPCDAQLSRLAASGIRWVDIAERLRGLRGKDVVLMLDHCFSGGVDFEVSRAYAANEARRALVESSILTLTASTDQEESWEDPAWRHGAFTYAALEALNGSVPRVIESGGIIMLDALALYLHREVPRLVSQVKGPEVHQTPNIYRPPGASVDVPVAKVR